jgi:hypothetical protein
MEHEGSKDSEEAKNGESGKMPRGSFASSLSFDSLC